MKARPDGQGLPSKHKPALVAAALAVLAALVYSPSLTHDFVNFDDNIFILDNEVVRQGLTGQGVLWAFTSAPYSCPLAWVSHMADVSLFGLRAGGHHLVNVLLHAANAALLLLVLHRMTRVLWPSAAVAALFAWHPLHVESVAWIAERRDVLSTLFWWLMLLAYVRYVERPGWRRYVPVFLCLLLGLLSKAMLVTAPFLLLVLDFWPLRRITEGLPRGARELQPAAILTRVLQLALEKAPLFVLAAFFVLEGLFTARMTGLLETTAGLPLGLRLSNVVTGYVRYLGMTVWPADLIVMYPLESVVSSGKLAFAALVLMALTALACWQWRSRPYLLAGWLWFLGTLVPVIGFIQGGQQSVADRYTYVPVVGLFIAVAWVAHGAVARTPRVARPLAFVASAILIACAWASVLQLRHWRDRFALWTHVLEVAPDNAFGNYGMGRALLDVGQIEAAIPHLAKAKSSNLPSWELNNRLGAACAQLGRLDEAITHFEESARLRETPDALLNLGRALASRGRHAEARARWREALPAPESSSRMERFTAAVMNEARRHTEDAEWHCNLGELFLLQGRHAEAAAAFGETLKLRPNHSGATAGLQQALSRLEPMRSPAPNPKP